MNKQEHWKDKLQNAGSFPYTPANKELAWQKLNSRLGGKKRRKSAVWYWAAAACLLPLILFVFFYRNTQQPVSIVKSTTQKPVITKSSIGTKQESKAIVIIKPPTQTVIKNKQPQKAEQRDKTAVAEHKELPSPTDSITMNNIVNITASTDSSHNIVSIIPPQKRKLKVVHINELNESEQTVPVIAHNYYPKFLPLQIARESIYPEPVNAINNTGFVKLKKKIVN